jgi:hypothetical protein
MIETQVIDGRSAVVAYMTENLEPAERDAAALVSRVRRAKEAARKVDTSGGFFERYPGAKRIGYAY